MKLTIDIEPIPQARVRFGKGRVYQPARTRKYQDEIAWVAREEMKDRPPITKPISVAVRLYRKYQRTARQFGDVDNHLKAIFDALTGIVFKDDSQIVSCRVDKFTDKQRPRVEIELETSGQ